VENAVTQGENVLNTVLAKRQQWR